MVCATLFNWVDVSVACTSTPRLSVNQATACCCAVLIIAHNTVYVLHAGISLDTVCFVQARQWGRYNIQTRHKDQAGIDLKKNITSKACFNAVKYPIAIMPKLDALYDSLCTYFRISLNYDMIQPKRRRRQLHRGWSMMWIRMWCTMPSLPRLSERDVWDMICNKSSNKTNGVCSGIRRLHITQNDLHKLVWHLHQSSLIARLPQHHHSHVHNVLCRQGPQSMCGWRPGLGCRYCGVTSMIEWCVSWIRKSLTKWKTFTRFYPRNDQWTNLASKSIAWQHAVIVHSNIQCIAPTEHKW